LTRTPKKDAPITGGSRGLSWRQFLGKLSFYPRGLQWGERKINSEQGLAIFRQLSAVKPPNAVALCRSGNTYSHPEKGATIQGPNS